MANDKRWRFSRKFKSEAVRLGGQEGAPVAQVALARINHQMDQKRPPCLA